ncbi:MAG TPA: DUF2867 domain-containing protein [Dysgonomonas sp.]|nr:DUF2867 domain-containing protein [Dysgonomonas sp.]
MKVKLGRIPDDSLIRKYFPADYSDCYQCTVVNDKCITPDDLQIAFWTNKPEWIDTLFKIRNFLVKPFGLKTGEPDAGIIENCIRNSTSTGIFSVVDKTSEETIIRLSDKHLDACISAHFRPVESGSTVMSFITVVHIHNLAGYLYFYPILPFHHIVVKSMVGDTIKRLMRDKG